MFEKSRWDGGGNQGEPEPPGNAPADLADLKNLGPVSSARLKAVGIETPEDLRRAGAVDAYVRLKRQYPFETTLVALYALEGALTDTHWYTLPEETKVQLRAEAARRL